MLPMTIDQTMALLAAGIGGGIAGTMASVASVVSYPALLALGLPPLAANVTNTMALVFCVPGAMLGARPELSGQRPRLLRFGAVLAAGGALGACALLLAPPGAFALVVPVLIGMAAAAVLLLLAALAATLSEPLVRINAIKNVIAGAANLVAALLFARYAPVDW